MGSTVGYVMSSLWVQYLPVIWLVIPLGALSLVSVAMSVLLVQEPQFVFEEDVVLLQKPGFFQRLRASPLIFLNVPRLSDFRRLFKGIRNELTSYVPLLYLSIIIFYLASGVFNTSFVPALSSHSLTDSQIYAVNVAALVAQIISFRYAGKIHREEVAHWSRRPSPAAQGRVIRSHGTHLGPRPRESSSGFLH